MKRYKLGIEHHAMSGFSGEPSMLEDAAGEWVKYGSEEMTRDFCPRCAVKHLGKAGILMKEAKLGYPHHVWYAMSNMSEAEDEIVDMMPEEAEAIREQRLKIQASLIAQDEKIYSPDFKVLMYLVAIAGMLEEAPEEGYPSASGH